MSWASKIGGGISDAWKSATKGILNPFKPYTTSPYQVDPSLFQDQNAAADKAGYAAAIQQAMGQQAPTAQAAQMNLGPQDQFRASQMGLVGQLQDEANGVGPSLAQGQLQQATDQNIHQAMALGASGPLANQNPALAARLVGENAANIQQQAAGQSAQARLQEQLAAQGMLANVSGAARGQDIGVAGQQAGYQQQTNLANQGASLQNQAQINQLVEFYRQAGLTVDQAQFAAQQQLGALQQQAALAAQGINAAGYQGAQSNVMGLIGGLAKGASDVASSAGTAGAAGGGGAAAGAGAGAAAAAAAGGAVVPGRDRGVDERPYMLRPGEVVLNPERRQAYAAALSQPDSPRPGVDVGQPIGLPPAAPLPSRTEDYIQALRRALMAPVGGIGQGRSPMSAGATASLYGGPGDLNAGGAG